VSSFIRINTQAQLSPCSAVPIEAVLSGVATETGNVQYETTDGKVTTGIWQCTPYAEHLVCDGFTEFSTILQGKIALTNNDGQVETFSAGDSYVLPVGWQGRFEVLETVRKVYVITVV